MTDHKNMMFAALLDILDGMVKIARGATTSFKILLALQARNDRQPPEVEVEIKADAPP